MRVKTTLTDSFILWRPLNVLNTDTVPGTCAKAISQIRLWVLNEVGHLVKLSVGDEGPQKMCWSMLGQAKRPENQKVRKDAFNGLTLTWNKMSKNVLLCTTFYVCLFIKLLRHLKLSACLKGSIILTMPRAVKQSNFLLLFMKTSKCCQSFLW